PNSRRFGQRNGEFDEKTAPQTVKNGPRGRSDFSQKNFCVIIKSVKVRKQRAASASKTNARKWRGDLREGRDQPGAGEDGRFHEHRLDQDDPALRRDRKF